jgi:hypothetical protein
MSNRCIPTEWPAQIVIAVVATNSPNALHVKVTGPAINAVAVMLAVQSDFVGAQATRPWVASLWDCDHIRPVEIVRIVAPHMLAAVGEGMRR